MAPCGTSARRSRKVSTSRIIIKNKHINHTGGKKKPPDYRDKSVKEFYFSVETPLSTGNTIGA